MHNYKIFRLCIFHFIDHSKSSRLNDNENDKLNFYILLTKQCFTRLELNQTRSSVE